MLSQSDFAGKVLPSLEEIRERVTRVETEVRHMRFHVHKLEAAMEKHVAGHAPESESSGGTYTATRLSRKVLGGGSIAGGSIAAVVIGVGKVIGWW